MPATTKPGRTYPNHDAMAFELALSLPIMDVVEALQHLLQQHGELPRRVLNKELAYIEELLKQAKATLATWTKEAEAPGVHEALACIRNALDALDWAHLAVEEGSILQTGETLHIALQALQKGQNHMEAFIKWVNQITQSHSGEPPPKRHRMTERPSGSDHVPHYEPRHPAPARDRDPPELLHPLPRRGDSEVPHGDRGAPRREGEATPYSVLRAQEILRTVMPFAEHEMALSLGEAHAHLAQWTQALWGHPIQLVEDRDETGQTQMETGEDPAPSEAETVPANNRWSGTRRRTTMDSAAMERRKAPSHRRRRLQAALEGTSESERSD